MPKASPSGCSNRLWFAPRYNLRNSLRDENVSGKMDPSDKERLEKEVEETIRWLDDNQLADVSCVTGRIKARRRRVETRSVLVAVRDCIGQKGEESTLETKKEGGARIQG
jgi:hypothetical protein